MQFIKKLIIVSNEIVAECRTAIHRAEEYAWNETTKPVRKMTAKVQNKYESTNKDREEDLLSQQWQKQEYGVNV